MNIFASDDCPIECATNLDSKRLVKMVVETTQILSTVRSKKGLTHPYKPTHMNHPCVKWAGESFGNYDWLFHHYQALCREYTARYKREHKCLGHMPTLMLGRGYFLEQRQTPFANCTIFKDNPDYKGSGVIFAYQEYLKHKWNMDTISGRPPKWGLKKPSFLP